MTDTEQTLYERIGGEQGVKQLVDLFYENMFTLPDVEAVRSAHNPETLEEINLKLFKYFSGWFGGPPLFVSEYGHPRLRARHLHVEVGTEESEQWMICLRSALKTMRVDQALYDDLIEKIEPMAFHMRNKVGDADSDC